VLGLSIFPPLLAALAMAKEGEQKTILQVYVSSISAPRILVGEIIAFDGCGIGRSVSSCLRYVHLFWPELCR